MLASMPLLRVLDRMGYGGIVLGTDGQVMAINDGAQRILQQMFDLTEQERTGLRESGRDLVKQLLSRGKTRVELDKENWILITPPGKRPLIMHAMPALEFTAGERDTSSEVEPHTVLILMDLDSGPQPNRAALERIFGFTQAEARLAALLADGATPSEAAQALGVSVATVRTQLGSIFTKSQTRRQAELVMLVTRLSALP